MKQRTKSDMHLTTPKASYSQIKQVDSLLMILNRIIKVIDANIIYQQEIIKKITNFIQPQITHA